MNFNDPFDKKPSNNFEFILIGTDGIWQGGDLHDQNGFKKQKGESVT